MKRVIKENYSGEDSGSWLNTYADMVTLLLTFFILMFSMSTINVEKWEEVMESTKEINEDSSDKINAESLTDIKESETIEDVEMAEPTDFDELYRHLRDYINNNDMMDSISAYRGSDYVFLRFKSNVFFGPDSSVLKEEAREILDKLCDAMSGISSKIEMLKVTGHTADVISNSQYPISDRGLSTERANNVVEFIEEKNMIEPSKLVSIGYGKYYPIGDNNTIEGQAENRRVEIYISEIDIERAAVTKLYSEINNKDTTIEEEKNDIAEASDELTLDEVNDLDRS